MINIGNLFRNAPQWGVTGPFDHIVVDDFLESEVAEKVYQEFPGYDATVWHEYNNPIEIKRVCNDWNAFPATTYSVFSYLNSAEFCQTLETSLDIGVSLYSDSGLNGGGWHIHAAGGKLNHHLDYSLHPKLKLERKLNIIIYLCRDWEESWGGHFGLWNNSSAECPGELIKKISPAFNRAVIFDTTQNSWHGLATPVSAPDGRCRMSLASYYLTEPNDTTDQRGKALFAPTRDQVGDAVIEDLIEKRSQLSTAKTVYQATDDD